MSGEVKLLTGGCCQLKRFRTSYQQLVPIIAQLRFPVAVKMFVKLSAQKQIHSLQGLYCLSGRTSVTGRVPVAISCKSCHHICGS